MNRRILQVSLSTTAALFAFAFAFTGIASANGDNSWFPTTTAPTTTQPPTTTAPTTTQPTTTAPTTTQPTVSTGVPPVPPVTTVVPAPTTTGGIATQSEPAPALVYKAKVDCAAGRAVVVVTNSGDATGITTITIDGVAQTTTVVAGGTAEVSGDLGPRHEEAAVEITASESDVLSFSEALTVNCSPAALLASQSEPQPQPCVETPGESESSKAGFGMWALLGAAGTGLLAGVGVSRRRRNGELADGEEEDGFDEAGDELTDIDTVDELPDEDHVV